MTTSAAVRKGPSKVRVDAVGFSRAWEMHAKFLLADTLIPIVLVLPVSAIIWVFGGYFTINGISSVMPKIAEYVKIPFLVEWWTNLGRLQWIVPASFTLAEVVWAPFKKFFHGFDPEMPKSKIAIFGVTGIFDWATSAVGMAALTGFWVGINWFVSFFLTFLPEQAAIWSVKTVWNRWYWFVTDAWFGRWEAQTA